MFYDPTAQIDQGATEYRELPEGNYKAVITNSIWKPSKKGTMMMEVDFQVVGGENAGVNQRHWLNLGSDNEMAAEIARKELHAICKDLKLDKPITNEDELVAFFNWATGKPLTFAIKRKLDREGTMRSRIVKFGVDLSRPAQTPPPPKPQSVVIETDQPLDDMPF